MLKLPVPEAEYENVVLKPSGYQQDMVSSLADRTELVRNRLVEKLERLFALNALINMDEKGMIHLVWTMRWRKNWE